MTRPRILIVGGGSAGIACARCLERLPVSGEAELALAALLGYELCPPLLPQVAAGVPTPQSVAVSPRRVLRRTRIVPGAAPGVDPAAKVCVVRPITDEVVRECYELVVPASCSVTPSDLADTAEDPRERAARLRFVVVGGGYAGAETAGCLQRNTLAAAHRCPMLPPDTIEWHFVDLALRLMPELGDQLGDRAPELLRHRGIEAALGATVAAAGSGEVLLTDGRRMSPHTLLWTTENVASPLIASMEAGTVRERLAVTGEPTAPGLDGVLAFGDADAGAVPDLATDGDAMCPPLAQHALRRGRTAGTDVAARVREQRLRPYRHRDPGPLVDLGGFGSVSRPPGIPLSGLAAQMPARGYHLLAPPAFVARTRVVVERALKAVAGDDFVRTGFLARRPTPIRDREVAGGWLTPDEVRAVSTGSGRKEQAA
ncbi:NAD(P)/FAD-dependent oxidoreductase [Streptomyces hokutonensis]|uniref:NAD(P)/FAD-dependent oxidoreductase n=1 Tax=Streptomyces hokutonensis TaxID=1306990 RepID=UPI0033EA281C